MVVVLTSSSSDTLVAAYVTIMLVLGFSLNVTCSILDEIYLMDKRAFLADALNSTHIPPTAAPTLFLEADAITSCKSSGRFSY